MGREAFFQQHKRDKNWRDTLQTFDAAEATQWKGMPLLPMHAQRTGWLVGRLGLLCAALGIPQPACCRGGSRDWPDVLLASPHTSQVIACGPCCRR